MINLKNSASRPRQAVAGLKDDPALSKYLARIIKAGEQQSSGVGKRSPKAQAQQSKTVSRLKSGLQALVRQDYVTASKQIQRAIEMDERNPLAWRMLALAFERQGEFAKAFTAYEAAARLAPDDISLLSEVGRLAHRLNKLELAESLFERFLISDPGNEQVINSLACVLRDQNRYDDAFALLRDILNINPESSSLWNTLGSVLSDSGDTAGAMVFYDEALRLQPSLYQARNNRASCFSVLGQPEKALEEMEIASHDMTDPHEINNTRLSKAFIQLRIGDLVGGFESYEARFDAGEDGAVRFTEFGKRWTTDDDLRGKSLLVYGEQGLGDEVLFANVVNDALDAIGPDGRLILAVEPRLVTLFQRSFPRAVVLGQKPVARFNTLFRTVDLGTPHPPIDYWVPLASLCRRFRTAPTSFPRDPGFLVPDPQRVAHWRQVLAEQGPLPKVGVMWKSLIMKGARVRGFAPFDLWGSVLAVPGVQFVNLQYGDCSSEMAKAEAAGLNLWTPPGIDLKANLEDVAALCSALDLVIGPMAATTNIAAACSTPSWIISMPDCWPRFGTDGLPCYPSARLFSADGFGQWDGVMDRIEDALRQEIAQTNVGSSAAA